MTTTIISFFRALLRQNKILSSLRNVHKIKLDFRYELWPIHRQILGTIPRISPKIWLAQAENSSRTNSNFILFPFLTVLSILGLLTASISVWAETVHSNHNTAESPGDRLWFTANKGQWDKHIAYRAELHGAKLYLEKDRLTWQLLNMDDIEAIHDCHHQKGCQTKQLSVRAHAFQIQFVGMHTQSYFATTCSSPAVSNYFYGNNPDNWATDVPSFAEVSYQQIYAGIDMRLYSQNEHMKYDFIVKPNADTRQIQLKYEGIDQLFLDKDGNLHIINSVNNIIDQAPIVFQYVAGQEKRVPCRFVLKGQTVGFEFPQGYDHSKELIIDPSLIFASYSGSTADNWGMTATYDNGGNLYAAGVVFGAGYPTTLGAYDISFNGSMTDIGVSKFNPSGSSLLYSTYIGGSRTELPHSLVVNAAGQLVILGTTSSANFPATAGAYDNAFNGGTAVSVSGIEYSSGSDIVVVVVNAAGNGLVGSTYIGGSQNDGLNTSAQLRYNYADEARGEIFTDAQDNIYVASCTNSSNFPTINAFQANKSNDQDACIFKLSPDVSTLLWSSFLGGTADDAAYSVKINGAGEAYVSGGTRSNTFPTTAGVLHSNYMGGNADGFLAKISSTGNQLLACTYLGTSQYDQAFFVELDDENRVYTVGQTGGNYPVTAGVYSNSNSGQFVHCLNNNFTSTLFSTTFGNGNGEPNISPSAFLVDICNRIYVSGWGTSESGFGMPPTFGTTGLPTTSDAIQPFTDGNDFYFILLGEDAATLEYATYFGASGGGPEHVDGGTSRFDKQGQIYQAVCAGCGGYNTFPTTPGAWSNTNNGGNCNMGVIKFDFDPPITLASAAVYPSAIGCLPYTVTFADASINATDYYWELSTGYTTTEQSFDYTFDQAGIYYFTLISSNDQTCNIADTTGSIITVIDPNSFVANFTTDANCETFTVTASSGIPYSSHVWQFGDGTVLTGDPATHTFSGPGIYQITHIISPTLPNCGTGDTVTQTVNITPPVLAGFSASDTLGCIPMSVQFNNQSTNATAFQWDLGNGQTSTEANPIATYPTPGTYTVSLTAINPQSCNGSDIYTYHITALDTIIFADFNYLLPGPCDPLSVQFGTSLPPQLTYEWDFGDGHTATGVSAPANLYDEPGTYTVRLIASSPCAPPDTAYQTFVLVPPNIVEGSFEPPVSGCTPITVNLTATGNAQTYQWDLGDGTTSGGTTVSHVYEQPGSYVIELTAIDPTTCNGEDISTATLNVYSYATALFEMSTDTIEANYEVLFTNLSSNADAYQWTFGDGGSSDEFQPVHTYSQAGNYNVCLEAINEHGCNETICQPIVVIPPIFWGIPNAFSPNNDHVNDLFYVEGRQYMEFMDLKIFNRWGELVFSSNDPQESWDGTYKGMAQDMDVFVYTFSAQLISGRRISGKGNLTLLR